MTNLKQFYLSNNQIGLVECTQVLNKMENLDLDDNNLEYIEFVQFFPSLKFLYAKNNKKKGIENSLKLQKL